MQSVSSSTREMATRSSILAWRILWTEEPDGLLSMESHRVGHDWSDLACMHVLEKEMATHSSILAWRIQGTEEPGGLLSMGSQSRTWLKWLSSISSSSWLSSPQHCLPLSWEHFWSSSLLPNSSLPFQICYHQPLPILVCPSFLKHKHRLRLHLHYAFVPFFQPSTYLSLSTWKYSVS